MVFVNLGYAKLDDSVSQLATNNLETEFPSGNSVSPATNAFSVDQQSGKVSVNFFGDLNLNGNSILNVSKILGMWGKWSIDENGNIVANKVTAKEVVTEKLCVDDICVTRDQFKAIFGSSSNEPSEPVALPTQEPVQEEETVATETTATTTEISTVEDADSATTTQPNFSDPDGNSASSNGAGENLGGQAATSTP